MNVLRNKVTTSIITQGPGTDMDIVVVCFFFALIKITLSAFDKEERRFEEA